MSENPASRDFFDRARSFAAAALVLTGALAVIGCFLDWVTFSLDEPPGSITQQSPSSPIAGTKVSDWKVVFAGGVVVIVCAILLAIRKRGIYAWICFVASIIIGAIAVADYRGLGDPTSGFLRGLEHTLGTTVQGEGHPAAGLAMIAVSGVGGLIASVIGIAATPHRSD